jgi:hypothetical protein
MEGVIASKLRKEYEKICIILWVVYLGSVIHAVLYAALEKG